MPRGPLSVVLNVALPIEKVKSGTLHCLVARSILSTEKVDKIELKLDHCMVSNVALSIGKVKSDDWNLT